MYAVICKYNNGGNVTTIRNLSYAFFITLFFFFFLDINKRLDIGLHDSS